MLDVPGGALNRSQKVRLSIQEDHFLDLLPSRKSATRWQLSRQLCSALVRASLNQGR